MANITEKSQWESSIPLLSTMDAVLGGDERSNANKQAALLANRTTYLKGKQEASQNEITAARGTFVSLSAKLDSLVTSVSQGDITMAGTAGTTVVHNLGNLTYAVDIMATVDTGGDMGDVYITKTANAFTVFNTGGFRGSARYKINV